MSGTHIFSGIKNKVPDRIAVTAGLVPGWATGSIVGYAPAVGGTFQSNCNGVTGILAYPTVLETIAIASTSADDAAAGIGARTVLVQGLDESFNPVSAIVTMNGQTKVTIGTDMYRVQHITVITAGSYERNVGDIYIASNSDTFTAGIPTAPYSAIEQEWSVSRAGIYTVPIGKRLFSIAINASTDQAKPVNVAIEIRSNGIWYRLTQQQYTGVISFTEVIAPAIDAGTDIRIIGMTPGGSPGQIMIFVHFLEVNT